LPKNSAGYNRAENIHHEAEQIEDEGNAGTLVNRDRPCNSLSTKVSSMSPRASCGLGFGLRNFAALPLRPITREIPPEQRQAIEAIVHDYLMQNPDVLIEALRRPRTRPAAMPTPRPRWC
jgi:hypothetical protein